MLQDQPFLYLNSAESLINHPMLQDMVLPDEQLVSTDLTGDDKMHTLLLVSRMRDLSFSRLNLTSGCTSCRSLFLSVNGCVYG